MINVSVLTLFIPAFLFISVTSDMCMTSSMTMGMSIGLRRTFRIEKNAFLTIRPLSVI